MFKNKVILILGAGNEQLPAYKICKKNSATIIAVDKNKDAPGLKLADHKIITSIRNDNNLVDKIKKLKITVSAVLTVANDIPEIYYNICKKLKVKNISKKSALLGSNKLKLYRELKKNNILVPDFSIIQNIDQGKKILLHKNFPLVIKPCDGRGSRGVNFVKSAKNFDLLYADSLKNTDAKSLILQKYIEGKQISSESMLFNNKIYTILSLRNYSKAKNFYPSIIENGGDIPLQIDKKIRKKIDLLLLKISKILKIKNNPLKCDLIINKGKIYVIEAAPRLGGGYLASHSSEVLYGLNFLFLYIKILLGIEDKKIRFIYKKNYLSLRFIFSKKIGTIKKIIRPNLDIFKKNIVHKVFDVKNLKSIKTVKSHADRLGCILIQSKHRNEAIKIAEKLTNSYIIKIK